MSGGPPLWNIGGAQPLTTNPAINMRTATTQHPIAAIIPTVPLSNNRKPMKRYINVFPQYVMMKVKYPKNENTYNSTSKSRAPKIMEKIELNIMRGLVAGGTLSLTTLIAITNALPTRQNNWIVFGEFHSHPIVRIMNRRLCRT